MTTVDRCYLCGSGRRERRPGGVRDNPALEVYRCLDCGLVYLSSRDHVDAAAYAESAMLGGRPADLERRLRDNAADDRRRYDFLREKLVNRRVLDFGSGVGGFAVRAQELAATVECVELERAVYGFYRERGIPIHSDLDALPDGAFDLVTAFHVIEHLPDPAATLGRFRRLLANGGEILVEVPNADDALLTLYESDAFSRFTYWSFHLYLFNAATLRRLAERAGLRVDFVKQVQRYPLSNHLHWLARGRPGGHRSWAFLDSPELHAAYEKQLAALGGCDTLVAGLSVPPETGP